MILTSLPLSIISYAPINAFTMRPRLSGLSPDARITNAAFHIINSFCCFVLTVPAGRYDLPDEGESQRSRYSRNTRVPRAAEFSDQRARTERSEAGASPFV